MPIIWDDQQDTATATLEPRGRIVWDDQPEESLPGAPSPPERASRQGPALSSEDTEVRDDAYWAEVFAPPRRPVLDSMPVRAARNAVTGAIDTVNVGATMLGEAGAELGGFLGIPGSEDLERAYQQDRQSIYDAQQRDAVYNEREAKRGILAKTLPDGIGSAVDAGLVDAGSMVAESALAASTGGSAAIGQLPKLGKISAGLRNLAGYYATKSYQGSLRDNPDRVDLAILHALVEGGATLIGGAAGAGTAGLAGQRAIARAASQVSLSKPFQVLRAMGVESVEEVATELTHYLTDVAGGVKNFDGVELAGILNRTAAVSALGGGGAAFVSSMVDGIADRQKKTDANLTLARKVEANEPVSRGDLEKAGIPSIGTNAKTRQKIARKEIESVPLPEAPNEQQPIASPVPTPPLPQTEQPAVPDVPPQQPSPQAAQPIDRGAGLPVVPATPEGPAQEVTVGPRQEKNWKKVYHGTTRQYDGAPSVSSFKDGEAAGIYLTESSDQAKKWGGWDDAGNTARVIELEYNLSNPASKKDKAAAINELEATAGSEWTPQQLTDLLKSKGFDGIVDDDYIGNEIVVFDDSQIRPTSSVPIVPAQQGSTESAGGAPLELSREVPTDPGSLLPDTPATIGFEDGGRVQFSGIPNFIPGRKQTRTDTLPDSIKVDRPEVEQALEAAHGVRKEGWLDALSRMASQKWAAVTRPDVHIPNTPEFAPYQHFFRMQRDVSQLPADETARLMAHIVDPIGPNQLRAFERLLISRNQASALDRGEPLRFGFKDSDEVTQYRDKLEKVAEATPEIKTALERRKQVQAAVVDELVGVGALPEAVRGSDDYFHQQVLMYLEAGRTPGGSSPRVRKKGFQKRRVQGEELGREADYNTSYLEAEAAWLTDALVTIRQHKLNGILKNQSDAITSQLQQEAGEGGDIDSVLRNHPELDKWQPQPGNSLYPATTIPEKFIEAVQQQDIEALSDLTPEQLRTVIAMGAPKPSLILPVEVVTQLDTLSKQPAVESWLEPWRVMMREWKRWTLLNPKRVIPYNLRNITGDIEPLLGVAPQAIKQIPKATRELRDYYTGVNLKPSAALRSALENGVISSGINRQEIPRLADTKLFKRFNVNERSNILAIPAKATQEYFDAMKQVSDFREGVLRYAAFLHFKGELDGDGVTNYAATTKGVVDTLHKELGSDVAAGRLSRDLLGDYGNITVTGDWIRRNLIPFWSFQEINVKRYPRMIVNSLKAGDTKAALKAGAGAAARAGLVAAGLTLRLGALQAALWVWNHLFHGDEEKDLDQYSRNNPHINLGRNEDGSVRVFRNVGALGDFMEWFGINDFVSLLPAYQDEQISGWDMVKESAKAPINKLVSGVTPALKVPFEVISGESSFPDVFNPRPIPRDEAVAGIVGLQDEYRSLRGAITDDGSRSGPNYLQKYLVGVTDPRKNALSELYDLRNRYWQSKGKDTPPPSSISKSKNMRLAAQNDDYEAFAEAARKYKEEGGTAKGFKSSVQRILPLPAQKDVPDFEQNFLTDVQRQKLKVAVDYSTIIQGRMIQWWERAGDGEKEITGSLLYQATSPKPTWKSGTRRSGPKWESYQERLQKYESSRQRAIDTLKAAGDLGSLRASLVDEQRRRGLNAAMFDDKGNLTAFGRRLQQVRTLGL